MKRLMIAAAIAFAAVAAQATNVNISLNVIWLPESNYQYLYNGTAYLIFSDTISQASAVAAFDSAGASSYETAIASQAAGLLSVVDGGANDVTVDLSALDEIYALCFDSENNRMYVSSVASYTALGGGRYNFSSQDDLSLAAAMAASSGYSSAGWYTTSVPEPTSGLLLLLGMAGLALKRKIA